MDAMTEARWGVVAAIVASSIWGCGPLLFGALAHVAPTELLAHRTLWAAAFVGVFCLVTGRAARLAATLAEPRSVFFLFGTASLIAINWLTFIWSVQAGRAIEAGVGYYLMPLVSVLLGVAVLGERLTPRQWGAVGFAAAGVTVLSLGTGTPPWVPILLATTFSTYGLLRKRAPVGAIVGFEVEALTLCPIAALWLAAMAAGAPDPFGGPPPQFGGDMTTTGLMVLSGLFTGLPLILFAEAARRLAYATTGLIQYLNPSLQVVFASLVLAEPVTPWHLLALAAIWAALGLYSAELLRGARAARRAAIASAGVEATPTVAENPAATKPSRSM